MVLFAFAAAAGVKQVEAQVTRVEVERALRRAADFYWKKVSTEGGYHYYYAEDLSYGRSEHGEGPTQIEVQREATPIVGLAYLRAWDATGDRFYLDAARAAAHALIRGQHCSGGWDYIIEFGPEKRRKYPYRAGNNCGAPNTGQHYTTLDDNVTQAAVRLLMRVDRELKFEDKKIHEAVLFALDQLSKAQYPNGAWPQRYYQFADPARFPVKKASYPESRTWPGPDYRFLYTFNDNTISDLIDMFFEAWRVYADDRYRRAAEKGGEFILLAQMPEPQPAWAQQYDVEMHPAWARVFEPPSVTGGESQGIIRTLLVLYRETGDKKYLEPARRALDYLKRSMLPPTESPSEARRRFKPGEPVLARFYELKTNRPLYITKGTRVTVAGKGTTLVGGYELSYSDESVISHYGVLTSGAELAEIAAEYQRLATADPSTIKRPVKLRGLSPWSAASRANPAESELATQVSRIISQLDSRGAWVEEGSIGKAGQIVSVFAAKEMVVKIGDRVMPLKENETLEVFQGTDRPRERIIRSSTFARNVETLSAWLAATKR
ncbi:MAG: pectate lyase [Blastocatellia bacterium]